MPTLPTASLSIMAPPNPHLRDNPQRLKEVDQHIESLRSMLKFLESERRRLTAIPADAHPVGVPEVLGYIMEWGVHLDAFQPELLLQVSRHWNHVALSTPGVWARIVRKPTYMDNFSQFLLRCRKYLERSRSHPLYIDVDFLYFYFESPTNAVYTQFAELIQPHLHRCYHLSLANPRESLAYLFSSLSPDVEHIAHYCANATHRGAPLALPPVLPRLRHLSGTFPLNIFADIDLPALEHLQIALSPTNPNFHDLLYILQRCPNLKCLLFDNVTFTLAVEPDLTSVLVSLHQLNRLEFHCSGTADAMLLTSHCEMPNIRELCISGNMLPIPLDLFRNITTLHCSDWDFPWFIRALRVATQLESLTVRSHGADSPFHTDLLPALSNMASSTSSSSLTNPTTPVPSSWLVPRLRTLHLSSLSYTDFPIDAFLTFLRKRAASYAVQTIQKLVLEDVTHLTDFAVEQLQSEVEDVQVIKTATPPMSFPFFPMTRAGAADGVVAPASPAAAMHPIILPPVAYGAPIVFPPTPNTPLDGNNGEGDVDVVGGVGLITGNEMEVASARSRRTRLASPVTLNLSRSLPPSRSRSRSPHRLSIRVTNSRHARSRSRSSSPLSTGGLRPPTHGGGNPLYTRRSQGRSIDTRLSRSPNAATVVVVGSGQSTSSRSPSPIEGLTRLQRSRSPSLGSSLRNRQLRINTDPENLRETYDDELGDWNLLSQPDPLPEMPRQSTIIVRSPSAGYSSEEDEQRQEPQVENRASRTSRRNGTPPRRHSLLPSMSSSTARSSTESESESETESRSASRISVEQSDNGIVDAVEFDAFGRSSIRPRPVHVMLSTSTDSTLPTGRERTALMAQATELEIEAARIAAHTLNTQRHILPVDDNSLDPLSIQTIQNIQSIQSIQGLQGLQGIQGLQSLQGLQGIQGIQRPFSFGGKGRRRSHPHGHGARNSHVDNDMALFVPVPLTSVPMTSHEANHSMTLPRQFHPSVAALTSEHGRRASAPDIKATGINTDSHGRRGSLWSRLKNLVK